MEDDSTQLALDDAPPSVDADALEGLPKVGERVAGKYEIERVLGAGGMGVVVAAKNVALGDEVAIKFLSPKALRDKDSVARFVREARTAVKIKSEHVTQVRDIGTIEATGSPFIVMERLEGHDLNKVLRLGGPLPIERAVEYVLQACIAISEAHALGIVHRDLKPANLFLTTRPDGTALVKVLDFGISKAIDADALGQREKDLTDTRAVFGSPTYMSPEQVRSAKNVDSRTDVWSLGVILFELLTGGVPFQAETTAGVLAAIAADEPRGVRDLREEVPAELEQVIMRALKKDLGARWQLVADLAQALRPFTPEGKALVERILRMSTTGPVGSGRLPARRSSAPPPGSDPRQPSASAPGSGPSAAKSVATEKPVTTAVTFGREGHTKSLAARGAIALGTAAVAALAIALVVRAQPSAPPAARSASAPSASIAADPAPLPAAPPAPLPAPAPPAPPGLAPTAPTAPPSAVASASSAPRAPSRPAGRAPRAAQTARASSGAAPAAPTAPIEDTATRDSH